MTTIAVSESVDREARIVAAWAINSGQVHPAPPVTHGPKPMSQEQRQYNRKRALDRYYAKRNAWVKAGLTTQGKVRVRGPYTSTKSLTPEQRRAHYLQVKKDWRERNRNKNQ